MSPQLILSILLFIVTPIFSHYIKLHRWIRITSLAVALILLFWAGVIYLFQSNQSIPEDPNSRVLARQDSTKIDSTKIKALATTPKLSRQPQSIRVDSIPIINAPNSNVSINQQGGVVNQNIYNAPPEIEPSYEIIPDSLLVVTKKQWRQAVPNTTKYKRESMPDSFYLSSYKLIVRNTRNVEFMYLIVQNPHLIGIGYIPSKGFYSSNSGLIPEDSTTAYAIISEPIGTNILQIATDLEKDLVQSIVDIRFKLRE